MNVKSGNLGLKQEIIATVLDLTDSLLWCSSRMVLLYRLGQTGSTFQKSCFSR